MLDVLLYVRLAEAMVPGLSSGVVADTVIVLSVDWENVNLVGSAMLTASDHKTKLQNCEECLGSQAEDPLYHLEPLLKGLESRFYVLQKG